MCGGTAERAFVAALAKELGIAVGSNQLHLDASAAKAMAERTSIPNRVKHMAIRFLFLQQMVKEKQIMLRKVPGEKNRADLMTKPVTRGVLEKLRPHLGLAVLALPLVEGASPLEEDILQHAVVYAVKLAINWPSALMGAITMLAVIIGCYVVFKLKLNSDTAGTEKKEKSVQGPVTHTGLRHGGEALPGRFLPLNDSSWGAWP